MIASIILLIIIIDLFLIYNLFFSKWNPSLSNKLKTKRFFYYGHRGAPAVAPENTIISFQNAIDSQMDGVELDIQLTKDQHLIVYHDKYIDYKKKSTVISSLNLSEIHTIDVKNQFEELEFQTIPLLEDVIKIIPDNIILNIEIKSYRWDFFKSLERQLIQLINKHSIGNQVIISSFNPRIIKKIKKIDSNIPTALIWSSDSSYNYKILSYYSKPDALHVNINDINKIIVDWCQNRSISLYAYTVNEKSDLDKAKKYNLNGIFTDNPEIKNV